MAYAPKIKTGDAWHDLAALKLKTGGAWHDVAKGFVKIDDVWHQFYGAAGGGGPSLTVTQQVSSVSGSRSGPGFCSSTTARGVVTNGTAPFTYSWTKVSGDTFTIQSPTAISTFFFTSLNDGDYLSGIYRLTVTDSAVPPASAFADVTVIMQAL